jgi:hypothetical protein
MLNSTALSRILLVPEERLELSRGYPHRILSLTTSVTTTEMTPKEPVISGFHYTNDWPLFGVFCCRTRTKGGRKTALNSLIGQCSPDLHSGAPV